LPSCMIYRLVGLDKNNVQ